MATNTTENVGVTESSPLEDSGTIKPGDTDIGQTATIGQAATSKNSATAPLRVPVFRRIWSASILSNFGQLILGVGVAWEMTRLTDSSTMVALVQTAMMLPLMLIALPAGAIADMFDRRKVAMTGLGIAALFGSLLSLLAFFELTTPWLLLLFCSLIGTGVALYNPAWQSSIGEQVEPRQLPAAIALNTISYNIARSFGPALGGLLVVAAGAQVAFAMNAFGYLPLMLAFFLWQRGQVPSRLPPERITRAIVSGVRYAFHSSSIRTVVIRGFIFGCGSVTATALAPLIARDLLGGDASTFGILLGAGGVGAVTGALMINTVHEHLGAEKSVSILTVVCGLALVGIGLSRSLPLTCFGMFLAGGASMITISLLNISVQVSVPRWVTARALSLYSSLLTGGIALGAWVWGSVADYWTIDIAMMASGGYMLILPIFALFLRLPNATTTGSEPVDLASEPEVELAITMRSGPIVIEMEYWIEPDDARAYYDVMQDVRKVRLRNGGFDWSITRDIGEPALWTERFHLPTWGDYLRMRDRSTQADLDVQSTANQFLIPDKPKRIRRGLERPFGSVRWKVGTPDTQQDNVVFMGP